MYVYLFEFEPAPECWPTGERWPTKAVVVAEDIIRAEGRIAKHFGHVQKLMIQDWSVLGVASAATTESSVVCWND